jgi:signal-transduction protein with cAMP-binding, CBS, and nucleotidyltransferase domain
MSKKFTYTKTTGHYFCMASDQWEEYKVDFEYEIEDYRLLPEIVDLLFADYFFDNEEICESDELTNDIKEKLKEIIDTNNLVDIFAKQYEDTLKEIFEEEAMNWFQD